MIFLYRILVAHPLGHNWLSSNLFNHKHCMTTGLKKIISGGQTGADRAALDAAIASAMPHGGWLPRGRKTEDGPLDKRYQLQEIPSEYYRDRTRKNILESDGTVIITYGPLTGGSALTEALAIRHDRPCLLLNLEYIPIPNAVKALRQWLHEHDITLLNVAGPRASGEPQIYQAVYTIISSLCQQDQ